LNSYFEDINFEYSVSARARFNTSNKTL